MSSIIRTLNFKHIALTLTGSAQALTASADTFTTEFELYCGAANVGSVFLGDSTVDNTWIPRDKGTRTNFKPEDIGGEPKAFDLSKLFVTGTLNDTIVIQYRVIAST